MKEVVMFTVVQLAIITTKEFRLEDDGIWKEFEVQSRSWLNRGEATYAVAAIAPKKATKPHAEWTEAIASLSGWKKELAATKAAKANQQEPIFDEEGWDF